MEINFKTIDPENWRIATSLKVKISQAKYVAPSTTILARAFAYRSSNSEVYIIYNANTPIGIIMQYDYSENDKLVCSLNEFMISEKYQGKGYGKQAMKLWISMIKEKNLYDSISLCYIEGNKPACNLYLNMGFYHTGLVDGNEIVMKYDLN
ncbi:GNAT family N-acetyltransferase [Haloimpatiens sp. FM7315]|uniref:GNAT family N-acetyltransferase n=1 Tax=Haloimpatiens sp. FM7315 TaxID=3298609 RepID=UPI0035A39AED